MGSVLVIGLAVSGCSGADQGASGSASGDGQSAQASASAKGFDNPVYDSDFPDPMIVRTDTGYLAIATNGNGMNVQTLTSPDMVHWDQGSDALPQVASWSGPGKVWAPEIIKWTDGSYRLYYTTKGPDADFQCLSVATAAKPEGPFADDSTKPLVCETDEGGSIDGSPFIDSSGKAWFSWKNDGNAVGKDTWIRIAPLSADGKTLAGNAKNLIKQDQPWEGNLVEGPSFVENNGKIHLFYSANSYGGDKYAVGHAIADTPDGTYTKDPEPVLTSNDVVAGPGHDQTIKVGSQWWMVYHGWPADHVGDAAYGRQMYLTRFRFEGDRPIIDPTQAHVPVMP